MKLELLAFGQKMPGWLEEGIASYQKRLPKTHALAVTELPLQKRSKGVSAQILRKESDLMLSHLKSSAHVIAFEINGKAMTSEDMAKRLAALELTTSHIQFLVGGPEGLSQECSNAAHEKWSLSYLTLSHPLVRLFLAESLYRSWAINHNHPYHK